MWLYLRMILGLGTRDLEWSLDVVVFKLIPARPVTRDPLDLESIYNEVVSRQNPAS